MSRILMRKAFKETIPIMMGYLVLGIAFGVLLVSKNYPIYYALLMSIFIYAGSMQFVAVSLLVTKSSLLNALMITLMINARHFAYGISMLTKFKNLGYFKPYMIFSLTDETYSLLVKNDCKDKNLAFLISFFDQCYWVIGSLLGATIGSQISFNSRGLEFSMVALFIVIVIDQIKNNTSHEVTVIGFIISILALFVFGKEKFVIVSMIAIIVILVIYKINWRKNMNHDLLLILVIALGTLFTRALPFIVFKDNRNSTNLIDYLGKVLPFAIMAMLVIYCLKDIDFLGSNHGLPEIIAVIITIVIHLWKNNILLSIVIGTFSYMICVQLIFI